MDVRPRMGLQLDEKWTYGIRLAYVHWRLPKRCSSGWFERSLKFDSGSAKDGATALNHSSD